MKNTTLLQQFRQAVYQILPKRADASLDLVDALTVAGHVASPVALSEEGPFRRKFSMIYDVLSEGQIEATQLQPVLTEALPAEAETLAGYEVYAVDTTPDERPEAATLPDRGLLKTQKNVPVRLGQKFSWLVRLIQPGTSWVAPWDVRRVNTASTDNETAVAQVQALEASSPRLKVVVADSLYANVLFLAGFVQTLTTVALVRLRQNLNLVEPPEAKPAGSKGAPRKHGRTFKMGQPGRAPDRSETLHLGLQTIRLSAWHGLHFRKLAALVGVAVRVEFLKADGTLRYQRPMWLFWTGPTTVALTELCRMYLWRFAIEHAFRFMKQHLGLNAHCLTDNAAIQRWMWLCALAYWQLLLMSRDVEDLCPAWDPHPPHPEQAWLTPGQVQRAAGRFLVKMGTPAAAPRPAGKGHGRAKAYRPDPRTRYAVVRKGQKAPKKASVPALSSA